MRKLIPIFFLLLLFTCVYVALILIPAQAVKTYGVPSPRLTYSQRIQYSAKLLWYDGLLTNPINTAANEQPFPVEIGESVNSVAIRLQEAGLIRDAVSFRDYLIYTGLDTSIQAGSYQLSPAMSAIAIARKLQDATSADVKFVVLPGWRMEELAASLPTSGLPITPEEFLTLTNSTSDQYDFLSGANSLEGFLFPDTYIFPRTTSAQNVLDELLRNFSLQLSSNLTNGFDVQGLTIYQAVTLASIVEREAVQDGEKPLIASVYINRIRIGMKLEADPTVQYAIGFNSAQNTWWTNPLGYNDLQFDSPFNTYLYAGYPPTPISNPGLNSLQAVAYPVQTTYYYFRAKCDGSGLHSFSETFEEHLGNGCQ